MVVSKPFFKRFKPYVRWVILALTLGFLIHTLLQNWQQVLQLRFTATAIASLIVATGITLLSHIWSGWVWHWTLRTLEVAVADTWSVIIYLKTNIAKYLPGNVWHFVGRIQALRTVGISTGAAVTGVVLEPLLMAAAALMIVVISQPSALLQGGLLMVALVGVHPRILNPILKRLTTAKLKMSELKTSEQSSSPKEAPSLNRYPLWPLLGEVLFVLGRGLGFLLALSTLTTISVQDGLSIIGHFSLAWLLGLVVPGAPGGLGVFEATALALLTPQLPAAPVLGAIALYRLISTLAEALGAGLAIVDERWNQVVESTIHDT